MTTVLLTGASGFVGRQVLPQLTAKGADVVALGRGGPPDFLPSSVRWLRLDLLQANQADLEAVCARAEAEILVHLAWESRHGLVWTSPTNLDWLAASGRLCRAFVDSGGKRIVVAGTGVEYAAPDHGPCLESQTPVRPNQLYGETKDAFRRELMSLAVTAEISACWARLFFLFGPHEKSERLVPSVVDALLEGRPAECSSGTQMRDYMDVRDCGAAVAAIALSRITGEVNVGSGQPTRLRDFLLRIGTQIGSPHLIHLGALPDRPNEPINLWPDIERLRDEVGFAPEYDMDVAIDDAIAWRRALRMAMEAAPRD